MRQLPRLAVLRVIHSRYEASEYFNIGEKKMRKLVAENMDSGFVIQNGVKVLIKRKRFEAFLDDLSAI